MGIAVLIVFMGFGIFSMVKPVLALKLGDIFKLKGERQYTDYAIESTVIGGFILTVTSATILFFYIRELIS